MSVKVREIGLFDLNSTETWQGPTIYQAHTKVVLRR